MRGSRAAAQTRDGKGFASAEPGLQLALESSIDDQAAHMDNAIRHHALTSIDFSRDGLIALVESEASALVRELVGEPRKRAMRILAAAREIQHNDPRHDRVLAELGRENANGLPRHRAINSLVSVAMKERKR